MVALYLTFGILGLLVFGLSIFGNLDHSIDFHGVDFGHDIDLAHDGFDHMTESPSLFSMRTIAAFLAGFGVSGLLAKWVLGWGIWGQLLLGCGTGVAIAALAFGIMALFYSQQAGGIRDSSTLMGKTAVVTTGVGSQGIGECRVDNQFYTFREKNGVVLQPNQVAKVVQSEPGLLIVEKL